MAIPSWMVGTLVAAFSMGGCHAVFSHSLSSVRSRRSWVPCSIAAGIGVVVAAIAGMSDAQKAMVKTAIKPFVSGMKEIGQAAADSIFGGAGSAEMVARGNQFRDTIAHMTNALTSSNMMGLVKQVGGAVADVGNGWAKSLDSPGFKHFLDVMAKSLPDQIKGLGHILTGVVAASVIPLSRCSPGHLVHRLA